MDMSSWPSFDLVRSLRRRAIVGGTELLPLRARLNKNND